MTAHGAHGTDRDTPEARLRTLLADIREAQAHYRTYAAVPCQTDAAWHADTFEGWADRIEAALSSLASAPAETRAILQTLRDAGHLGVDVDKALRIAAVWSDPSAEPEKEPR